MEAVVTQSVVDIFLTNLATNKIFNGLIMAFMNIGGKYLVMELPGNLEQMFSKYQFMRYCVIFAVFFMATRDIKWALFIALFFIIVVKYLINEKSKFCIIKSLKNEEPKEEKKEITKDDFEKAKKIIDFYLENNQNEIQNFHRF